MAIVFLSEPLIVFQHIFDIITFFSVYSAFPPVVLPESFCFCRIPNNIEQSLGNAELDQILINNPSYKDDKFQVSFSLIVH